MLTITGQTVGVKRLEFLPSEPHLVDDLGSVFIRNAQYAVPDANGRFVVELLSTDEAWSRHGQWQWLCTEVAAQYGWYRRVNFAFSSAPGELDYATIRTLGRGL